MFHQLLTPVGGSLALSSLVALLPIAIVLVVLGILKRAAWQAALSGLVVAIAIAVTIWGMPVRMTFAAAADGAVFAVWPVMWIVVNALLLYNIAVASGRFDAFRD
jgi:lactate permease